MHLLLLFSHPVVSDSLPPHGLQHARLPGPSLSPGVCCNSCPLSQWCHPTISSSVSPFFFSTFIQLSHPLLPKLSFILRIFNMFLTMGSFQNIYSVLSFKTFFSIPYPSSLATALCLFSPSLPSFLNSESPQPVPSPLLPFISTVESGFCPHHSPETSFAVDTSDFPTDKSNEHFSVFWLTWCFWIINFYCLPSWKFVLQWIPVLFLDSPPSSVAAFWASLSFPKPKISVFPVSTFCFPTVCLHAKSLQSYLTLWLYGL